MSKGLLCFLLLVLFNSVKAQVGIGTESPKATLDITAKESLGTFENAEGILIPRVSRERLQSMKDVEKSTMVYVNDILSGNSDPIINAEGFYFYDGNGWRKISNEVSLPQFFYMPSVILPTIETDSRITDVTNTDYSFSSGEFTVNLYSLYKKQFTAPVISSLDSSAAQNSSENLEAIVKEATSYSYFVTYADSNVFEDISLNENGILKYKVKANSIIRTGTFMNIVIKNK